MSTKVLDKSYITKVIEAVLSVTVSPDSKYIVTGGQDHSVTILDIELKQKVHAFRYVIGSKVHKLSYMIIGAIYSVVVTPDNRKIIVGGSTSIAILDMKRKEGQHLIKDLHRSNLFLQLADDKALS